MEKLGIIFKKISSFNYVKTTDNSIYSCSVRGTFSYNNLNTLVGDQVMINVFDKSQAIITKILPRKNYLYRPQIANVDQAGIVMSLKIPNFSTYLLNKYLALIEYKNLEPLLIFTKIDLVDQNDLLWEKIAWYQKQKYLIFFINNKLAFDQDINKINELKKKLNKKLTVFIGQTGSGKSSTLNNLLGKEIIKTQEVSSALNRGKHTTTRNELYQVEDGLIADTPGFSSFKLENFNKEDLAIAFKIFAKEISNCKFRGCLHNNEPHCAIKKLVDKGIIAKFFYQDYLQLLNEMEK